MVLMKITLQNYKYIIIILRSKPIEEHLEDPIWSCPGLIRAENWLVPANLCETSDYESLFFRRRPTFCAASVYSVTHNEILRILRPSLSRCYIKLMTFKSRS